MISLCSASRAQNINFDKRQVLFYVFDTPTKSNKIVSKSLERNTDTLLIKDIILLLENENGSIDSVSCKFTNNTILFPKLDTLNNILKISLSVNLYFSSSKNRFDERLTFPYKSVLEQTNSSSLVSISFERKRNNLFRISISKLDYPFLIVTYFLPSEILGIYKSRKISK